MSKTVSRPEPAGASSKSGAGGLSRLLAVDSVPDSGLDIKICATDAERAALAAECGLVAVEAFEADLHVTKQGHARFKVNGAVQARVIQICVVSLEPFEAAVHAGIDADFVTSGPDLKGTAGLACVTADDPPDPVINGQIDLGTLAAEFFVLNLDLYPRKPGTVFEHKEAGSAASEDVSPFAVLQRRR